MSTLGKKLPKTIIDFTKKSKPNFTNIIEKCNEKSVILVDHIYLLKKNADTNKTYLIKDHVNLSGKSPLIGPQFIAMNNIYDNGLSTVDLGNILRSPLSVVQNPIVVAGLKNGVIPNMYEKKKLLDAEVEAYSYNIVQAAILAKSKNIKVIGIGIPAEI